MIMIFKSTDNGLEAVPDIVTGCWVNIVDPTPAELAGLPDLLCIPPDFAAYPLDQDELARTEKENGATLAVIRVPYFQGAGADIPYTTAPLGLILTDRLVATISRTQTEVLQDFQHSRVRSLSTGKRNRFVLRVLLRTASQYLAHLREINRVTDMLEDRLQRSLRNRELLELLKYQKSLVYFTTALKSNGLMLERLQKSQMFLAFPEDQDLLDDVLTENQQAIEMTGIASNILSQMMDAFASIISNNLNVVMKFLASVTIILTVPTMIASFYGMNVTLPHAGPYAFLIILGLSTLIVTALGFVFWKLDWL